MKKVILIIGILVMIISAHVLLAQTEAVITYESRVNMWKRIPPERESMKSMIPEYMVRKAELFTNGSESMYKPVVEEEEDAQFNSSGGAGGGMRFRMRGNDTEIYVNYIDQIRLSEQEFNGKKYLVTDTIQITPWKFGAETKEILGFMCKQAFYSDEERKMEVVAWYTDKLGMFIGPETFGSLPGVILAVDVNNAERTIVALNVENKKLGKNDIKVPTTGTTISGKEFRAMVQEEMKKHGATGSGGAFIIRN
ncbi:MAG: GLPGLI family protein [Cyclobacteriaceae bacterium]|nr:GLPGLI family protein [Cyclobacteriaceae bacterium]